MSPEKELNSRQATHLEWRVNPITGETFQVYVPSSPKDMSVGRSNRQQLRHPAEGNKSVSFSLGETAGGEFLHSHQTTQLQDAHTKVHSSTNGQAYTNTPAIPGILSLDKSNKKRDSRTVEWAKNCLVKWAKSTNNTSINFPLYVWGSLAEIEASLSGRCQKLSEGETLGRLRHLKNIAEVCCLNSASSDFSSYGWTIARDYACKVEDDILLGHLSWPDMQPGVRTSSLVAAQMDCPRMYNKPTSKTEQKQSDKEKSSCTTYNSCLTKGKCEYEVKYPDKTCQRRHECLFCKTNFGQSFKHQSWDCRKKEAASNNQTSG